MELNHLATTALQHKVKVSKGVGDLTPPSFTDSQYVSPSSPIWEDVLCTRAKPSINSHKKQHPPETHMHSCQQQQIKKESSFITVLNLYISMDSILHLFSFLQHTFVCKYSLQLWYYKSHTKGHPHLITLFFDEHTVSEPEEETLNHERLMISS